MSRDEKKEVLWQLDEFEIKRKPFNRSFKREEYEGKIRFKNNEYESFSINLNQDQMNALLHVISDHVLGVAEEIADHLKKTFPTRQFHSEDFDELSSSSSSGSDDHES